MKYKVTEKHPYLKEGLIIEDVGKSPDYGFSIYNLGEAQELLSSKMHVSWMQYGWIEEIHELEYTKASMISFASFADNGEVVQDFDDSFDQWIKKIRNESRYKDEKENN